MKKSFLILAFALAATGLQAQIIFEGFGGSGANNLNGTVVTNTAGNTFSSGITSAGGSSTWLASVSPFTNNYFRANGDISPSGNNVSAYLLLGSYINDTRGTAAGKFELSATLSLPTSGSWTSLGFFQNVDGTYENGNFTASPPQGVASILYRSTATTGEVDGFAGGATPTSGNVQGSILTGTQLFTIVLDLTPTGGYNPGSTNFGKVSYFEGNSTTGNPIGSFTYTAQNSYQGVGFSTAGASGVIDNFTLTQIPEPSSALLLGLGLAGLLASRRRK